LKKTASALRLEANAREFAVKFSSQSESLAADYQGSLTIAGQRIGSAKKNLSYHNILILHKSKKQTVKDQLGYAKKLP